MGGGLMQLVAYGSQDVYLTGNPQITFFKMIYRRYTNFSIESIEQPFNGNVDFGRTLSATISRNGDLMYKTYLQVTLPEIECKTENDRFRWLNWIGHILIKHVEVEIGGQIIDKHYGDWIHIWNELSQPLGKQSGYANMVGNLPRLTQVITGNTNNQSSKIPSTTLYIPLQFWFCKNPGLALPLISLQYHQVKINIEFREAKSCYWASGSYEDIAPILNKSSLYVDYIYLDTDERRKFAKVNHEYLIEQLQFTGEETVSTQNNKIKLNFNHPVKELIWIIQPNSNIEYKTTKKFGGQQFFNYTDKIDNSYFSGTPNDPMGGGIIGGQYNNSGFPNSGFYYENTTDNTIYYPQSGYYPEQDMSTQQFPGVQNNNWNTIKGPNIHTEIFNDRNITDLPHSNTESEHMSLYDSGQNPVLEAKIQLNGHDRFSSRDGRYFNLVQPYAHHTNIPATGINVYSFCFYPEDHQPSGTCNFSRIDNASLILTITQNSVATINSRKKICKVRVYAINYNILRITSGMGGLAYSS
jgi:hypothetical protein